MAVFLLCPYVVEGTRELSGISLIKALISLMSAQPSWPTHLPVAPSPNTVTLGLSFNIWILEEQKHSNHSSLEWTLVMKVLCYHY